MDVIRLFYGLPDPIQTFALGVLRRSDTLRRWVTRRIVNRYAYAARPRPRPHSMAAPYTTWRGLVDRRYSGRHLPLAGEGGYPAPARPDVDEIAKLFERKEMRHAEDTSILFAFFAQWFVDGFLRTKWEPPGTQTFRFNESNHEIDLNQIYGSEEAQTRLLRELSEEPGRRGRLEMRTIEGSDWPMPLFEERDGKLELAERYRPRYGRPGLYTEANFERVFGSLRPEIADIVKRNAFAVGLEHGNSTLGQVAMNVVWMREHNRTAAILEKAHPDWDDERVFQTARNVTTAILLTIVIADYIVHIAPVPVPLTVVPGLAEREGWYRTNHIAVEFALLYRWHELIPERLSVGGEAFSDVGFLHPNGRLMQTGLAPVLEAASRQPAGRIGLRNTARFLLDKREDNGRDVKRLSIAMERTCDLASFNAYRAHYGLEPYRSFEALTGDPEEAEALRALYGDIDKLEWFVGLFAEKHEPGAMMGELMTVMVANDAFTQALTNPLIAKGVFGAEAFGAEGLTLVRETRTLAQVIARNTSVVDDGRIGFTLPKGAGRN